MHKKIIHWWHGRRERFYRQNRWHLVLDISLVVLTILLTGVALRLAFYNPQIMSALGFNHYLNIDKPVDSNLSLKVDTNIGQLFVNNDEAITLEINYFNDGDVKINQVIIKPDFNSAAFKLESLTLDDFNDSQSIEGKTLILKNIEVGASGQLLLTVNWSALKEDFPRSIDWHLKVEYVGDQREASKDLVLPSVKIASDFNLKANIYFHSPQGDQLGIGPLPPIVGIPTTYWLIVKAKNSGNDLKDFVFSANLAPGVELSGEESLLAGKYSYNKEQRRLIWQIDSLEASGGDYIANFGIDFTPASNQVGKNALILTNLQYHLLDTWTNAEVLGSLDNLDSSLPADHLNRGSGVVEAE
ncbi:hypothetical protein JXE04_01640 [Patescibacteria group bacterium]|nr:hypothetical protein [Patescibacteria group bacterium]